MSGASRKRNKKSNVDFLNAFTRRMEDVKSGQAAFEEHIQKLRDDSELTREEKVRKAESLAKSYGKIYDAYEHAEELRVARMERTTEREFIKLAKLAQRTGLTSTGDAVIDAKIEEFGMGAEKMRDLPRMELWKKENQEMIADVDAHWLPGEPTKVDGPEVEMLKVKHPFGRCCDLYPQCRCAK